MNQQDFPERYKRPSHVLWRTECLRTLGDLAALWVTWPRLAPREFGDGHGVLVLPGFLAGDSSTIVLRTVLGVHGFRARGWRMGPNIGPTAQLWSGSRRRLTDLFADAGRPVTLIGHSLGGIFARELARAHPEMVRQVITLGSPYRLSSEDDSTITSAGRIYEALQGLHVDMWSSSVREESRAAPGPGDLDLLARRWRGAVADLPRHQSPAGRERRGARQSLRHGRSPGRAGGDPGPATPACKRLGAVPRPCESLVGSAARVLKPDSTREGARRFHLIPSRESDLPATPPGC